MVHHRCIVSHFSTYTESEGLGQLVYIWSGISALLFASIVYETAHYKTYNKTWDSALQNLQ